MKFSENKTTGEITLKMSKSEVETFLFENDKLKNNLFNLTLAYFKNYKSDSKIFSDYDPIVIASRASMAALYDLIEKCGLEAEYQKYKSENYKED